MPEQYRDYVRDQLKIHTLTGYGVDEKYFKTLSEIEDYEWKISDEVVGKRKRKVTEIMAESLDQQAEEDERKQEKE